MPFELAMTQPRKIAVIGGGIAGMGAAVRLSETNQVTLFESDARLGGHARTVIAGKNNDMPVDTGFLVFNDANYPNLLALFEQLEVETENSDMSFGVSIKGGWLEYGVAKPRAIMAQKRNLIRPQFYKMMGDLLRFNRDALAAADDPEMTVGQLLDKMKMGDWFRDYYLLPFTGAIWSTPLQGVLDFPAQALLTFFKNHNLLAQTGQHQWRTVKGGSRNYVEKVERLLTSRGTDIRLNAPIQAVSRIGGQVHIRAHGGEAEIYDDVVIATHSDQALNMLTDASPYETANLGAIKYQPNEMILHADTSLMPKRRAAWASWVYTEDQNYPSDRIDLTYWINNLQNLPDDDPVFVTLNTNRPVNENLIYDTHTFMHPVFDCAAMQAQKTIDLMNGDRNTWFAGAWMRNGFHEDGLWSGYAAADSLMSKPFVALAAE